LAKIASGARQSARRTLAREDRFDLLIAAWTSLIMKKITMLKNKRRKRTQNSPPKPEQLELDFMREEAGAPQAGS
jgi:hypothetical protein